MEISAKTSKRKHERPTKNRGIKTGKRDEYGRITQRNSVFKNGERILKKTRALGTIQKEELIEIVSKGKEIGLTVKQICKISHISRSSCYYTLKHKNDKEQKDAFDLRLIQEIFDKKHQKAGIRTIYMKLQQNYGITMNLKKIARIKKQYGLITKIRKKNPYNVIIKKGLEHRTAPNLLQRQFDVHIPDTVYSTDISYLIYKGGQRAYLSAAKDLATKEIVAFNVSRDLSMQTAYLGLEETLKHKDCSRLMIHSDQGIHYTHPLYVNKLKELGVTQSMSRKGNCLDNAPIESFFGHLKDDLDIKSCKTFEEVKTLVENYIDYYNNERSQWNLNKMTPAQRRCHLLNAS